MNLRVARLCQMSLFALALGSLVASGCGKKVIEKQLYEVGLDGTAIDKTVDPCTDFYQHACGGWLTSAKPGTVYNARSFSTISRTVSDQLVALFQDAFKGRLAGDAGAARIIDLYSACINEDAGTKRGLAPLQGLLDAIDGIKDPDTLLAALVALHRADIPAGLAVALSSDLRDGARLLLSLGEGGLGPLSPEDYRGANRALYDDYAAALFAQARLDPLAAPAAVALEAELAAKALTPLMARDPAQSFHVLDRAALRALAPLFPWDAYLKALGAEAVTQIAVDNPAALQRLAALFAATPASAWQSYLRLRVLDNLVLWLPGGFGAEYYKLASALRGGGSAAPPPREYQCYNAVASVLPGELGSLYVKRTFGAGERNASAQMLREIVAVFGRSLAQVSWLDQTTRGRAQDKLAKIDQKVGYPDHFTTLDFPIDSADFLADALRYGAAAHQDRLRRMDQPVPRSEWFAPVFTVNAFYNPSNNDVSFPAAILRSPMFNLTSHVPVNFGAIGAVMGHELTHGFDDNGSRYDAGGALRDWWLPATRQRFEERVQCVRKQYSEFPALAGTAVDGALTVNENIADMGGIKLAFQGYRERMAMAQEEWVAAGYSEDQQFFLSYAQIWCTQIADSYQRYLLKVDEHAPARYRVQGPLANLPSFAEAFSCKDQSAMSPQGRCAVW